MGAAAVAVALAEADRDGDSDSSVAETAGETVGKSVSAAGVSLGGSGMRATVSAGGVSVGSEIRATGSDGGIGDGWGEGGSVDGRSPSSGRATNCDPDSIGGAGVGGEVADGADSRRLGLAFGGEAGARVATAGAVRTDAVFGDGAPITTSSTASGSAAKTTHGGPGRNPAVATKTMNQAVCNRTEIIIVTMSSDTGHERVAVTVRARGASFDAARGAESVGCGVAAAGASPAS